MKMCKLLFLLLACCCFTTTKAQTKPPADGVKTKNLLTQATQMVIAFNQGELEQFAAFTYPRVLQAMGGKAAMVDILKKQMNEWAEQGIGIDTVSVGEPSTIYKAGSELHALVSQTLVLHVKNGTLKKNSFLLAISSDGGARWYFVDTAPLNNTNIRQLFPAFNKELVIPAKQEPVFTPKQ